MSLFDVEPVPPLAYHLTGTNIPQKKFLMYKPSVMNTLSQILEKLRIKRQDNEFLITPQGFTTSNGKFYQAEDLLIIKIYRFESETDPADNSVVYILEAKDGTIGYTMDAYGVYSNHDDDGYDDFIRKIPVQDRDEQLIFA